MEKEATKTKISLSFRENGDPNDQTLLKWWEEAPLGAQLQIGSKVIIKEEDPPV